MTDKRIPTYQRPIHLRLVDSAVPPAQTTDEVLFEAYATNTLDHPDGLRGVLNAKFGELALAEPDLIAKLTQLEADGYIFPEDKTYLFILLGSRDPKNNPVVSQIIADIHSHSLPIFGLRELIVAAGVPEVLHQHVLESLSRLAVNSIARRPK